MTPEALKANTHYKAEYDHARSLYPDVPAPEWEDLTDEARENVRLECIRYSQEMQALGASLRKSST